MLSLIWRPEWVQAEISLWCLWSLICAANMPDGSETAVLLSNRKRGNFSCLLPSNAAAWESKDWPLVDRIGCLIELDHSRLEALTPFDLSNYHDREHLFSSKLRYCPACLRLGYHSVVFQHRAILHCPIHGEPIASCCPTCKKEVRSCFSSVAVYPFGCFSCGTQLGAIPDAKQTAALGSKTQHISAVRCALRREGPDRGQHSHMSSLVHRRDIAQLSERTMSKLLRIAYPDLPHEKRQRQTVHKYLLVDDHDDVGGEYSGLWADALDVYLSVKRHIEDNIECANRDFQDLQQILGFASMEISLPGVAYPAAIAFYRWRCLYDRGDAERWTGLRKRIEAGLYCPDNPLLAQLSDIVWESRKANRVVFEHELYATFTLLLLQALRSADLTHIRWLDSPGKHTLLPVWEIEHRADGRVVFGLHCRVGREFVERILCRLQGNGRNKSGGLFRRPRLRANPESSGDTLKERP